MFHLQSVAAALGRTRVRTRGCHRVLFSVSGFPAMTTTLVWAFVSGQLRTMSSVSASLLTAMTVLYSGLRARRSGQSMLLSSLGAISGHSP